MSSTLHDISAFFGALGAMAMAIYGVGIVIHGIWKGDANEKIIGLLAMILSYIMVMPR